VPPVRLLPAALKIVSVYADASYSSSSELGVGCWACTIPAFPASKAGIELGGSINRLELAAVMQGLLLATTLDHSGRRIHVHTDSDFVVAVMQHAANRTRLPGSKGYAAVADLYSQACDVTIGRTLTTTRRCIGDPHHAACDRVAKEELRLYCSNGKIAQTILLKRTEARRKEIINHIRRLESSLEKRHRQLLACDMEIGALQHARKREDTGSISFAW
jgi:ribonuclease HI